MKGEITLVNEINNKLPNPFLFEDGRKVNSVEDWSNRRKEIFDLIIDIQYGGMPPIPESTKVEVLHLHEGTEESVMSCRILTGPGNAFSFPMQLHIPKGKGPFPVVINGDGCWRFVTDEIIREVISRGMILARFNRVEIAPDIYNSDRISGIYRIYPEGNYGALSAWAWGYHRCVDALIKMDMVDASKIAITGHSRGGKAVLLAAATDERIALVSANNSGSGGAGSYKLQGPESETLADSIRMIPYWYGPRIQEYVGRENDMPFDQHYLKALIAPRSLLTTEALGDLWANPSGTWHTYSATREVYKFLGAENNIGIWYRVGGHNHGREDWCKFLDFMAWKLCGASCETKFNYNPFLNLC